MPLTIDKEIARLKLAGMDGAIDTLTGAQKKYLRPVNGDVGRTLKVSPGVVLNRSSPRNVPQGYASVAELPEA